MRLSLNYLWKSIRELSPSNVGKEFTNIGSAWNDHNSGVRSWDNLKAINATITNLTIPSSGTVTGFPGRILQIVKFTAATNVSSTSATYADTGISGTITPLSATSTIYFMCEVSGGCHVAAGQTTCMDMKLLRGASTLIGSIHGEVIAFGGAASVAEDVWSTVTFFESDAPATTSATTYKLQFARIAAVGTVYLMDASFTQGQAVGFLIEVQ